MAEAESEEAVKLRSKASEMLKNPSSIALPKRKKLKSSSFLTKASEMLKNLSSIALPKGKKLGVHELLVYSSLARLPTFSIGLSSNQGEDPPPRAPLRESSVDPKDKSPPRYFRMPALGASVLVGERDGFDTIACHLFDLSSLASDFHLDSEDAAVRSFYKDDHPGGLSDWLRAHPGELRRSKEYCKVILSGTELFVGSNFFNYGGITVGNLGGKCSSVSGSSSDYKDCTGDETIRPPSDVVEQPEDPVPSVHHNFGSDHWRTFEKPYLCRSIKGSYLKKPKFLKKKDRRSKYNPSEGDTLQLTTFDDFVILGNGHFKMLLPPREVIDIVQKNASETVRVIAAQLVKAAIKKAGRVFFHPITAIVIFLDHKEIVLREHKKEKKGDVSEMEDKKGIKMEDHKVKILGESLPNVHRTSTILLEENELGMKSTAVNSNLTSAKVQDDSEASSSTVLATEDDCKNEDIMVPHHITKWIIYGGLQERTLLCFFNIEEKQYEFYFEDHESMATIMGLGVPHSKVILECGSPHVIVVEIPEEDWDAMWAQSKGIPYSILKSYVLKQEQFPDILHHITNVIKIDNIVNKANNGGTGGDNGKGKAQGNVDDNKGKGKAHDHDDHENTSHPNGGSNGPLDDNDKKERKEKDGNDDKKDVRDQDDGKTSNDCKEVMVEVHLHLLPGGVLKEKNNISKVPYIPGSVILSNRAYKKEKEEKGHKGVEKKKEKPKGCCFPLKQHENSNVVGNRQKSTTITGVENGDVHESLHGNQEKSTTIKGVGNGDVESGEIQEVEEKIKEEGEGKKKELGEGHKGVEKKKKKQAKNENLVGNQQKLTTILGVENGGVDDSLKKQLENQIHSQMKFTFTIKDEGGGQLKAIQATIDPITFQLPSNNEENYLQWKRFGWFHDYLQVAFGVDNAQVAFLETKTCKALDFYEAKEVILKGISQGNSNTVTSEIKGEGGFHKIAKVIAKYSRIYGSGAQTTKEDTTALETKKEITKQGGFIISEHTDQNTHQLKYSYRPYSPFKEEELIHEDDCLKMYEKPICQLQQVSCEGTWKPDCSENMEAYTLKASRELRMTRICNLESKSGEEGKQKLVWKAEPLCFIQELEKKVYLNHAMSHLTSLVTSSIIGSTTKVYRHLQERQDPSSTSTTILTQEQSIKKPEWPSKVRLVDMRP